MAELTLKEIAEILAVIRSKLLRIIAIIAIGWFLGFSFIADYIISMIEAIKPKGAELIYRTPLEGLILKLKISLIIGVALSLPYVIYLIYKTLKERTDLLKDFSIKKSQVFILFVISVILFFIGVAYGYKIMLPIFLQFLYQSAEKQGVLSYYSLANYVSFVALMLCIFGIIFQMPLIMFVLVKNGITSLETFKYYRRHFYVAFFVIAAIITPPDVFTQLMVAVPMVIFYELSLLIVGLVT